MKRESLMAVIGTAMNEADSLFKEKSSHRGVDEASPELSDFFLFAYGYVADQVAKAVGITLEE